MQGERILKKTGEIELPTKLLKDIRGAHYSALVIAKTIKRNEMLERMPGINENRITTLKKLTNREQQYRAKRTDATIEEYSQIFLSDTPPCTKCNSKTERNRQYFAYARRSYLLQIKDCAYCTCSGGVILSRFKI